ncbi:MAG: recombinase family protein [Clostridiales bacterium]|nr:recombinase family protein [Clostridiales bacterium]
MNIKQRAAAYIRVSTEDQTEFSPDAQRKAIERYAEGNNMVLLPQCIYVDEGISGRKAEKRPAFMQMIAAAKGKVKPFDVILVHKFDRFARNREDSVVYKSLLRNKCGIKVISITENIEDDKISIIVEPMLEALAEYYSVNLSEEVKKGMTEKASRGEYQTIAPFGYKWEKGKLTVDEAEAEYVRYIFNQFLNSASQIQIARSLNKMGVHTHKGNSFENRTVDYILNNPVYAGFSRWTPTGKTLSKRIYDSSDTITAKGSHQPIISEETFNKAKEKLAVIKQTSPKNSRPAVEFKHYLSSIVKCSACGSSLAYSGSSGSMQCWKYSHALCSVSHSVSAKKVENAVENEFKNLISPHSIESYIKNPNIISSNDDNISSAKDQIKNLNKRLSRLKAAYLDGVFTLTEYKTEKKSIDREIDNLSRKITDRQSQKFDPKAFRANVSTVYSAIKDPSASIPEKNIAVKSVIEKIVYRKSSKELLFFYYF